jgi:protein-disulfide isomerase
MNHAPTYHRKALIWAIALAAAGLALSAELLRIHLTVVSDPFHPFACHISAAVDCNAVALSPQAVFLGVPVPIWALLVYVLFLVLALIGLRARTDPWKNAGDYILPLAAGSVLYSAYLAYVSAFVIKTFCLYCAGLYLVNLALLGAALVAGRPLRQYPLRRLADGRWLTQNSAAMGIAGGTALVLIVFLAGLYVWSSQPLLVQVSHDLKLDLSNDPMMGNPRAIITIIEFSDYECPACRKMHPVLDQLLKKYPDSIRIIHKNFPLDSQCNDSLQTRMHPRACEAAAAAECAHRFKKYQPFSQALWTAEDLSPTNLLKIASQVGLDPDLFNKCMTSPETKRALLADIEAGKNIKIQATPTFIINGYRFEGAQDLKWCERLIEKFLKGGKTPPSGKPLDSEPE